MKNATHALTLSQLYVLSEATPSLPLETDQDAFDSQTDRDAFDGQN